jgi:uncharacterized membrane protein
MRYVGRMKLSDIERMQADGLISGEQRGAIVAKYDLREDEGRFLRIVALIGAVLVASGIALLISANWQEIPSWLKIAVGLALMVGAHAAGYHLRDTRGDYPKTGDAFHLLGAGMFLANIALVGQIYNLSSHPPNAILLWWLGIAALPWLLRSPVQHLLSLLALALWFGMELNARNSLIYLGNSAAQVVFYATLGLLYFGLGTNLRRTRFDAFASATEKLGLLGFHAFLFPLTWRITFHQVNTGTPSHWVFAGMAVAACLLMFLGLRNDQRLDRQWRLIWGAALAGGAVLLAGALVAFSAAGAEWAGRGSGGFWDDVTGYNSVVALVWFILCVVQIQVGVQLRSSFLINLAVAAIALDLIATYISLFGTMTETGLMFLIGGIFLIGLGYYLEKKRRTLLRRMQPPAAPAGPLAPGAPIWQTGPAGPAAPAGPEAPAGPASPTSPAP